MDKHCQHRNRKCRYAFRITALKSINSFEKIQLRITVAKFNGNSSAITVSFYSPFTGMWYNAALQPGTAGIPNLALKNGMTAYCRFCWLLNDCSLRLELKTYVAVYFSEAYAFFQHISVGIYTVFYLPDHWLRGSVFVNGPGDQGSISGWVIPKTQKMVLDSSLLNIQHYNVHFKGKVE